MSAVDDLEQSKAELQAVIDTGIFAKAPSLALFLEYVCTKYFAGHANQIKEYNIAVEALGRPATFDPRQDSIVRVEAFRLRKRLREYYENGGAHRTLRIVIPAGQYVPQFLDNVAGNGEDDIQPGALVEGPGHELAIARHTAPLATPPVRLVWVRSAVFVGLLVITALILAFWFATSHSPASFPTAARPMPAAIRADSGEIRILAGSSASRYVDRDGNVWSGDQFFHGGSVFAVPGHPILGTPDPRLFQARREGEFSYDIPLKPGPYELHLYFAETLFGEDNTAGGGESSRVFQVFINGRSALWSFDVISDAGGSSTADERVFKDVSPALDGMLHIRFAPLFKEAPFLNAIEILPGTAGKMRPVRIVTNTRGLTDRRGRPWIGDRYFSHGSTVTRSEAVSGTSEPEIFASERFGNFIYAIPAAEGQYAVTLRFSETWFGAGKPGGGGVGSRLFDVYSNGVGLLRNFDILRTAGGPQRAVAKTFHGVIPNAQGKIVLSFVPVLNYACVNAIEVVDESN